VRRRWLPTCLLPRRLCRSLGRQSPEHERSELAHGHLGHSRSGRDHQSRRQDFRECPQPSVVPLSAGNSAAEQGRRARPRSDRWYRHRASVYRRQRARARAYVPAPAGIGSTRLPRRLHLSERRRLCRIQEVSRRELSGRAVLVPFDRLRTVREFSLQLTDRPRPVTELTLDRDVGMVMYSDNFLSDKSPLAYRVGVFGGGGKSRPRQEAGRAAGRPLGAAAARACRRQQRG
jgi:hypothetical protein